MTRSVAWRGILGVVNTVVFEQTGQPSVGWVTTLMSRASWSGPGCRRRSPPRRGHPRWRWNLSCGCRGAARTWGRRRPTSSFATWVVLPMRGPRPHARTSRSGVRPLTDAATADGRHGPGDLHPPASRCRSAWLTSSTASAPNPAGVLLDVADDPWPSRIAAVWHRRGARWSPAWRCCFTRQPSKSGFSAALTWKSTPIHRCDVRLSRGSPASVRAACTWQDGLYVALFDCR